MSAKPKLGGLVRHPARAIPVGLLAVALLAVGIPAVWLLGTLLLEGAWPQAADGALRTVGDTSLDSLPARIAAVVLAVLGLALLLCALVPGRPARVRVLDDTIPGETALSRRDLARRVQRRAEHVDGVHSVRAEVGRRRIDVVVQTVVDHTEPVRHSAQEAVERAVAELRPDGARRARVRVHRRS